MPVLLVGFQSVQTPLLQWFPLAAMVRQTERLADVHTWPSPSVLLSESETRLEHKCALTTSAGMLALCRPADLQGSVVQLIPLRTGVVIVWPEL